MGRPVPSRKLVPLKSMFKWEKTVAHKSFGVSGRSFGTSAFDVVPPTVIAGLARAAHADDALRLRPVVAARLLHLRLGADRILDPRRAAKLAGHHHQHPLVQAAQYRSSISAEIA